MQASFICRTAASRDRRGMTSTDHKRATAARLRQAIESLDMRQVDAARIMGVSPSQLGNWLRGAHYPDVFALTRFCGATGITMDWVFRGVLPAAEWPAGASVASGAGWAAPARPAGGHASETPGRSATVARRPSRRNLIQRT